MEIQSSTTAKLKEAAFFLELLIANHKDSKNDNKGKWEHFDYYLSAFISSSRSILWIMKKEYKGVVGWEEWYHSKKPSLEEKEFLKKINDIRVRSEKKEPLKTFIKAELTFKYPENQSKEVLQKLESMVGTKIVIATEDELESLDNSPTNDNSLVKLHFVESKYLFPFIEEFPDNSIIEVCCRYLVLILNLVKECIELFGLPKYEIQCKTSRSRGKLD